LALNDVSHLTIECGFDCVILWKFCTLAAVREDVNAPQAEPQLTIVDLVVLAHADPQKPNGVACEVLGSFLHPFPARPDDWHGDNSSARRRKFFEPAGRDLRIVDRKKPYLPHVDTLFDDQVLEREIAGRFERVPSMSFDERGHVILVAIDEGIAEKPPHLPVGRTMVEMLEPKIPLQLSDRAQHQLILRLSQAKHVLGHIVVDPPLATRDPGGLLPNTDHPLQLREDSLDRHPRFPFV
jgi:hypothetical protein